MFDRVLNTPLERIPFLCCILASYIPWKKILSQLLSRKFLKKQRYPEKEILAQVFPCEFFEIFKNTIFTEHL